MKLVLFDIDGTLLHTDGAGRQAFVNTIRAVLGKDDPIEYVSFAGNTDLNVLEQVADRHGIRLTPDLAKAFFDHMPGELTTLTADANLSIYPGVPELLDHLSARPDILLGLVTGNIESCAKIKLQCFDLDGYFEVGGYGDDHGDRVEIARLAVARAEKAAGRPYEQAFLIGDTPSDIAAARALDLVSVGVATGGYTVDALRQAGADHVFEDLSDLDHALSALRLT